MLKIDSTRWHAIQSWSCHLIGLELQTGFEVGNKLDRGGGTRYKEKLMISIGSLELEGLRIQLSHELVTKLDVKSDRGLSGPEISYSREFQEVVFQ